jgi:hypothetical protein
MLNVERIKYGMPFFLVLLFCDCLAQTQEPQAAPQIGGRSANSFFAEVGGNGLYYSLNYDKVGKMGKRAFLSVRIGIMVLPMRKGNWEFGIPVEVNASFGKENHYLEAGLGISYLHMNVWALSSYPQLQSAGMVHRFYRVLRIGYRYQRAEGGLFLKVGFTPMRLMEEYRPGDFNGTNYADLTQYAEPWAGVGVGWTMRK